MSLEHSPIRATSNGNGGQPKLITDLEAAELFGCSRSTIWRRVKDGTLPAPVRISGMTRFPLEEVVAVIERAKAARSETEAA